MNRFFIDGEITQNKIEIFGEDAHHIKNVLRLKEEETIICIKNEKEFVCNIDKIEKNSIILIVQEEISNNNVDNINITLFQGIPKGDKFDFIIEKAIECGVYEIVPLKLKRSIAKINEKDEKKKMERFSKIAKSAAQQSHRLYIPQVLSPITIKQIEFSKFDLKIVCYEDELKTTLKEVLKKHTSPKNIAVVIGPEGGIDETEVTYLLENGFVSASLGASILRCETAGIYTIANINYHYNN